MRTSKYRGLAVNMAEPTWLYGSLVVCDDGTCIIANYMERGFGMEREVRPETVGEFTGLTDKNGDEIYEDDIIHLKWEDYDDDFGVVKWHSNGYFYVDDCFGKFPKGDRRSLGSFFESIRRDYKGIEISINGNIHDNPELIRKKSLNH